MVGLQSLIKKIIKMSALKYFFGRAFFVFFLLPFFSVAAQKKPAIGHKIDVYSFFDNREFSNNPYMHSHTMTGIRYAPQLGVEKGPHSFYAGVNFLNEFGSPSLNDNKEPVCYYHYDSNPFQFYFGCFSRELLTEDSYPDVFFDDSISYYNPNINGFLLKYNKSALKGNFYLDWAGRRSDTVHEAFFIGGDLTYKRKSIFVETHFYSYHFAASNEDLGVRDNLLGDLAFGLDLTSKSSFDTLIVKAGALGNAERNRDLNTGWKSSGGGFVYLDIAYKGLGVKNNFYFGKGIMKDYNEYGSKVYWGNPLYRGDYYDRFDLYYTFVKDDIADLRIKFSGHFTEGKLHYGQYLTLRLNFAGILYGEK